MVEGDVSATKLCHYMNGPMDGRTERVPSTAEEITVALHSDRKTVMEDPTVPHAYEAVYQRVSDLLLFTGIE